MNKREVEMKSLRELQWFFSTVLQATTSVLEFSPFYALTDHPDIVGPAIKTPTCSLKMVPHHCFWQLADSNSGLFFLRDLLYKPAAGMNNVDCHIVGL